MWRSLLLETAQLLWEAAQRMCSASVMHQHSAGFSSHRVAQSLFLAAWPGMGPRISWKEVASDARANVMLTASNPESSLDCSMLPSANSGLQVAEELKERLQQAEYTQANLPKARVAAGAAC